MKSNWISTKIKSNYKKIILDFIPAFLGILLALFLNDWKDQRKENEFVSKSIINIYNDNRINIKKVEVLINHIEHQLDSISFYKDSNEVSIFELINKNKGLQLKQFKQSGWNILSNSQLVTKIDYELLSSLTLIRDVIDSQYLIRNNLANILYNSLENTHLSDKQRLHLILKDLNHKNKLFRNRSEKLDSILQKKYHRLLKEMD
jgi:hypothetical protein